MRDWWDYSGCVHTNFEVGLFRGNNLIAPFIEIKYVVKS